MNEKEYNKIKKDMELKVLLRQCLESNAYERLMNVRLANEELYLKASQIIITNFNRLGRRINDAELLKILIHLKGPSHEGSINIRGK